MAMSPSYSHLVLTALLMGIAAPDTVGAGSRPPGGSQRADPTQSDTIDTIVRSHLKSTGIEHAAPCTDAVFLRRVFVDAIGTLPEVEEARTFLESTIPDKRRILIDDLLSREEFTEFWTLKWCDLLRVKSEFPINLWPNAVQAYLRWIRDSIRQNQNWSAFARDLITSSGSNFRIPAVNFYRTVQGRDPVSMAAFVAQVFMGVRISNWTPERRSGLAAFFSRVQFKGTSEWKEEIVLLDPAPRPPVEARFPDDVSVTIPSEQDPRIVFADWLAAPGNRWFRRSIVNRIWSWLMGRGIIHEPDDLRPDNPPAHPGLLAHLEAQLVENGDDLRHIFRIILNSDTYQQSSEPSSPNADAERLFAHYPIRRLDAEILIDAICQVTGSPEKYSSAIPEPFTFIPEHHRTIALADGSITSPFLEMFGRPSRDSGLESERQNHINSTQRLHLLNSTHIHNKIKQGLKWRERAQAVDDRLSQGESQRPGESRRPGDSRWPGESRRPGKSTWPGMSRKPGRLSRPLEIVRDIYLSTLSRYPTEEEVDILKSYLQTSGLKPPEVAQDILWALINSKEFLFHH